ncbi:MAG TPA: hypothetical protein VFV98_10320 [Vicinamibacterales bacterium]|nr:hypothetical protein [Vicinamibacterales bacterium]
MANDSTVTVRIPASLKRAIQARARRSRRSLSAQVLHDLEQIVAGEGESASNTGAFLGMFRGTPVPTDGDIAEVRELLWGRLRGKRNP